MGVRFRLGVAFGILVSLLVMVPGAANAAGAFDWGPWEKILKARVAPVTVDGIRFNGVDYDGLRKDRAGFDRLVAKLGGFDPGGFSGKRKLAFWINAYNLGAVRHVLDNPKVASLNQVGPAKGAVWKLPALEVGGRAYSLDEIEHRILRKLGEPRIHFAIVCASISCPDLRPEAYTAGKLDAQLAEQTSAFLANPGKGVAIELDAKTLRVTRLFEWFAADFGGPMGVRAFIARHLPAVKELPAAGASFAFSYLDYDWRLNAR